MVEIGGLLSQLLSWFSSTIFWIIVTIVIVIAGFVALWVRKKRALLFKTFELNFLKDGKQVIEETSSGWFGKKKILFGLMDTGKDKVLKLKDGRRVHDFSIDDYHEYRKGGKVKRCVIVTPHPEDKSIVVPISHARLNQNSLLALYDVAPADFREAGIDAFDESARELRGTLDKYLPYILLGGIIIFFIVGIIINGQLITRSVDTAEAILKEAGTTLENVARLINTAPSNTAP